MSIRLCVTLSCLVAFAGLALVGCTKKPSPSPSPTKTSAEAGAQVTADLQKPVAEVQTQTQTMSIDTLKTVAAQYKQAISAKREDLQKVWAQVKEIPLTEALGEKAKTLKTNVQNIESSVKALTERFQVYYNQLKQKGADVTGLAI